MQRRAAKSQPVDLGHAMKLSRCHHLPTAHVSTTTGIGSECFLMTQVSHCGADEMEWEEEQDEARQHATPGGPSPITITHD